MKSSLPRLTAFAAMMATAALLAHATTLRSAQAQPLPTSASKDGAPANSMEPRGQPARPQSVGDELLLQVAAQLDRRSSVSARLRHQVFLFGSKLYGVGSYWQLGTGAELKVRMALQIAGQEASLLQISNSRFLWVDQQLPTGRRVSRVDLRKLRADPVLNAARLDELEPGTANWSSHEPALIAHSGGLPSLVASLSENFSFLPPQAMRLAAPTTAEGQPASVPVFAVVGHWKPAALVELTRKEEGAAEISAPLLESREAYLTGLGALPPRLPQEVLLIVGQADLFPYRLEFRRLETPLSADDSALFPYQLSPSPLVVLELTEVAFDVPIAADEFNYKPGDAEWVDQTAAVLERLHRERKTQLATRAANDLSSLPAR